MIRFKSFAANLGIATVSLLIILLLSEFFVRGFAPQQLIISNAGIWQPDSLMGWSHRPNIDVVVNTGDGPARFVSDSQGFRINANDAPPEVGLDYRILAVGDSFTEGLAVDNEDTFVQRLESQLLASGMRTEVVNAGVSGWNPFHYLLLSNRILREQSIDLGMIFLYVGNDIIADTTLEVESFGQRRPIRFPRSLRKKELVDAVLYPINNFLETKSQLFVLAKNGSTTLLSRVGLSAYYFPDVFKRSEASSQRWSLTASLVDRLDRVFRERGIPVVFVLIPTSYQVNEDVFYDYVEGFSIPVDSVDLEQPNVLLAQHMETPLVDLLTPLRDRAASGEILYGEVDAHFNERGHRAVADYLFPIVRDALIEQ